MGGRITMAQIIERDRGRIVLNGGVKQVTIPSRWQHFLNIEEKKEVNVALVEGKHGIFFAVWDDEQKSMEQIKEENTDGVL